MILTVVWLTHVAIQTDGDPKHPLFDFIFTVPLVGWLALILIWRLIERRGGGSGGDGDA